MQIKYKGATPIEKNVIVVDEQGNEYEATYPKRAKGLVKSGRARFVDENKICLACPPNEYLEDKTMTENQNINNQQNANKLTTKDIFEQIVILQKQLTENNYTSLHRLGDALTVVGDGEGSSDDGIEERSSQIDAICTVFSQREETLNSLLAFYKTMYTDVYQMEKRREKYELVAKIKYDYLEKIVSYVDEEGLSEAINQVRNDLECLCFDILEDRV